MSQVLMRKCDGCGIYATTKYEHKDWINFDKAVTITVAKGVYSSSWETSYKEDIEDFCGWKCFQKFVMTEEKKKK